jgi:hypothetical protein
LHDDPGDRRPSTIPGFAEIVIECDAHLLRGAWQVAAEA